MCRLRRRLLPCRTLVLLVALALASCASTTNHASPASVSDNQATPALPPYERASADQSSTLRRLSSAEEEWVIARAIAEHEMRRP